MGDMSRQGSQGGALAALMIAVRRCCWFEHDLKGLFKEASNGTTKVVRRNLRPITDSSLPARIDPEPEENVLASVQATSTAEPLIASDSNSTDQCMSSWRYELSSCNFENTQTLEWYYPEGSDCVEIPLPKPVSMKCDHVAWQSGEAIAVGILAGLGMGISLCFAVALRRYKKSRTVRQEYPGFCLAFVLGVGVMCASALTLLGRNTKFSCALRLWLWSTGFDLAFGVLMLKLWCAFSEDEGSSTKLNRVSFTTRKVQAVLALILLGDASVMASWTADSGGEHCRVYLEHIADESIERVSCVLCCRAHFFAWLALKVILVCICCYLSYRMRKIQSPMAETWTVAMAAYNVAVAALIVAAVLWANADAQVRTTMEAVAINLAGVGTLCAIIAPKILLAKQELEGKSLVGPSAVVANNSNIDSSCNGEVLFAGDALGSSRGLDPMHRTLSRHSSSGGGGGSVSISSGHTVTVGIFRKEGAAATAAVEAASSDVLPDLEGSPPSVDPCTDPKRSADDGKSGAQSTAGAGGGDGGSYMPPAGGNFASSGGGGSKGLIVPDPAGFWTPPRHIRRAQSSAEVITRTKDGMVLAAAASAAMTTAVGGGDTFGEKNRQLNQSGRGVRNSSSTASLSAERSSGHAISLPAKLPPSGASGSSRASRVSRFSRASSIGGGGYGSKSNRTSHSRSHSTSNSAGRISSGDYSSSLLSSTDGWNVDPLMVAMNGYGWGGGGGGNGGVGGGSSTLRQSVGGGSSLSRRKSGTVAVGGAGSGGGRRSGIWSSGGVGSLRRGSSREREASVGSSASAGRRSNVAGCLVMHADTGTRLHCPHCGKEVAGCGFKGCSGSLIRAPSFSDDDGGADTPVAGAPPPSRLSGTSVASAGGGLLHVEGRSGWSGRTSSGWGSNAGGMATAAGTAGVVLSPTQAYGSNNRPSLLRRSFRRGPSPCDTFDDETDSSMEEDGERSALGISSPTSSSAWP